ncbi:hypothetical protein [Methylopila sp. 73B]|uniref:hypothetical protein n=1 Tax=Methylopila sp. 73B TaxID=1120792 RepID=UPI0003AAABA8|nr:hypothetical protein [Methylopila sp. 73B]
MSVVRSAFAAVAALAAFIVAGCKDEQATTARSIQSIPAATVALMSEKGMKRTDPMLLRIYKEESKAEVWKKRSDGRYALLKSYDICRWSGTLGPKIKEGDKQAPEGFYSVSPAQMNPRSNYYLSFNIGFPNKYDQALGRSGRHLMVHGDCLSAGCYAMTDAQIAEIYALARESFAGGQKAFQVQALPFRMTAENMARRRNNPNIAFWRNLKEGSDNFEVTKLEPKVDACGKKYVFNASAGPLSSFEPTAACPTYTVQPEIAKAVAAKKRADDAVIAALTKSMEPAPEYVAQNGRMRRSLDQPIIQIAAVTPSATTPASSAQAFGPDAGTARALGTPLGATGPATQQIATVALHTPVPPANPDRAPAPQAVAAAEKPGLFTRMFRGDEPATTATVEPAAVAQPLPGAAPAAVARKPAPGRREIAVEPPVMASAVSPAPAPRAEEPRGSGIGGWVRSVGGLFGRAEEPAPQPAQVVPTSAPEAAPKPRERSARATDAFQPASKPDPRVTPAFAAFQ